jgi:CBS domain-containing protein
MFIIRHILAIKGNDIWSISPDETVLEALKRMAHKNVGVLLVMTHDTLKGIISERDYARKVILKNRASKDTLVKEIMTSAVITIHPDQTVEEAMELMTSHHIRHVPVVENDTVLGVISMGDVVQFIIKKQRETIKFYEEMDSDR